jgi:hypothetical protein
LWIAGVAILAAVAVLAGCITRVAGWIDGRGGAYRQGKSKGKEDEETQSGDAEHKASLPHHCLTSAALPCTLCRRNVALSRIMAIEIPTVQFRR